MKRILCCIVAAALIMSHAPALAAIWDKSHAIDCAEDNPNCRLLQMAMAGSFEAYDPEDALVSRIYASVYPQLCMISENDIAHCAMEFGEDEGAIRVSLYGALRNTLYAYILTEKRPTGRMTAAERVMLLFIDPSSQENAEFQMALIREEMTADVLNTIAESIGAPVGFVEWTISGR